MEKEHQGIQFHQALVAHGTIEDDPEEGQGATHDVGPDEYTDTDYEFEGTDDDTEGEGDADEATESPTEEMDQDHPAPPGNRVIEDRSLEEEATTLRQHLFAMEARAVQVGQERDEVIGEMTKMAQLLAQHFGI